MDLDSEAGWGILGGCHSFSGINILATEGIPCDFQVFAKVEDYKPKTPIFERGEENEKLYLNTLQEVSNTCCHRSKNSFVQEYLRFVNSARNWRENSYFHPRLREESPEPFKNIDYLKGIGLSAKQPTVQHHTSSRITIYSVAPRKETAKKHVIQRNREETIEICVEWGLLHH
ncbi:hypothetical protein SAY87_001479 [Trapa incisa]|uniref:Uncharacterized protein n=1 Tax=Trapa incisa TaxID=236973 RepID=A0AAN7GNL3_9MYRT|nr:hypothetical protein SAY87_001479 [Trapa incisa]